MRIEKLEKDVFYAVARVRSGEEADFPWKLYPKAKTTFPDS